MSLNFTKPDWYSAKNYDKLKNLTAVYFDCLSFSNSMKRINAGQMIHKFLTNIQVNNEKSDGGKKIYLYSGHDSNIAAFTRAHNFNNIPSVPDYGSAIIIEKLKKKDHQTYLRVRFFYYLKFDKYRKKNY